MGKRKSKYEDLDLTGERFGNLTAIKRLPDKVEVCKRDGHTRTTIQWECKCDCGNILTVGIYDLKRKNGTKACRSCTLNLKKDKDTTSIKTVDKKDIIAKLKEAKEKDEKKKKKIILHDNLVKNYFVPSNLKDLVENKTPISSLEACQLILDEGSGISMCFFDKNTDDRNSLYGAWSTVVPYFNTITNNSSETYNKYVRNKLTTDNLSDWLDKSINQFDENKSSKVKFWDIIPKEIRDLHNLTTTGTTTDVSVSIGDKREVIVYQHNYMNVEEMIMKLETYTNYMSDVDKIIWVINGIEKKNNLLNILAEMRRYPNLYVFVDNYNLSYAYDTRNFYQEVKLIYLDNEVFKNKTYFQLREEFETLIETKCSKISKKLFLQGIYNGDILMGINLAEANGSVLDLYDLIKARENELGKLKYFTVSNNYCKNTSKFYDTKTFVVTVEQIEKNGRISYNDDKYNGKKNEETVGYLYNIWNSEEQQNHNTDNSPNSFPFKERAMFGYFEKDGMTKDYSHIGWKIEAIYTTKGTYQISNKNVNIPKSWIPKLDKQYKEWAEKHTEKVETPTTETKPIEKTKPLIKLAPVEKKSETEVKPARAMTYEKYMEKRNAEPVKKETDNIQTFSFFNDELLPPNNITIKQIEGQGIIEIKFGIIPDADYYGFFMSDDKTFPDNRTLKMGKIKDTIFRVDNLRPKTYYIKGLSYNIAYGKTNKSDWSEVVEFTLK